MIQAGTVFGGTEKENTLLFQKSVAFYQCLLWKYFLID